MRFRRVLLPVVALICSGFAVTAQETPPVVAVPAGTVNVDDIGLYRVSWRYRSGTGGSMPMGWSGHFDDATGISCTPFGEQAGRHIFLIHPAWRGGTGVTDQVFRLKLPSSASIHLRFAVSMMIGQTGPGKSDGATFRVFADGKSLFDYNQTEAAWHDADLDLTPWAGKTVTLQFESDPGPKDNPSFDYAFWGDRTLLIAGGKTTSQKPLFQTVAHDFVNDYVRSAADTIWPARLQNPQCKLVLRPGRGTGPTGGATLTTVNKAGNTATYGLGSGGWLDLVGGDGKEYRSTSPVAHESFTQSVRGSSIMRKLKWVVKGRTIRAEVALSLVPGSGVQVSVRSTDPNISGVHFGALGPAAFRRQIGIPYFGNIQYMPDAGLFASVILDHKHSNASEMQGETAKYGALTDGGHRTVNETALFALSPDLLCVVPQPGNPASPFRPLLAGRAVLDSWGGMYRDNAAFLQELQSYRITDLLTIAHVWQHGGYDNQLPDVLPPYEPFGGADGMKVWTDTARRLGQQIALHENYVDFYPNAPSWNEADVALDSAGKRVLAWLNEGTGIQSFAVAPDAILKYAGQITPEVQKGFKPNASYLDVHSAVPPWFHVDFRADHPGSGKFSTVFNVHKDLWNLFRKTHNGPVLGEGNNHWFWSGLLDGVEAQFGTGVAGNAGTTAPLMPDFDLFAIHPLQYNHGMGYLERWLPADADKTWHGRIPPTLLLDQYRMQEAVYGHAAFIPTVFERSVPFLWQEHHLMTPLTRLTGTAAVKRIDYFSDDNAPRSASQAIAAGLNFTRVCVTYAGGIKVWANSTERVWQPSGTGERVPRYGWYAEGPGYQAGTVLKKGADGRDYTVDFSEFGGRFFINPRTEWAGPARPIRIHPTADQFVQTGPRRFKIRFSWQMGEAVPEGYRMYIHGTGQHGTGAEQILFQPAGGTHIPEQEWFDAAQKRPDQRIVGDTLEITLPAEAVGDVQLRTGFYRPGSGERLRLTGVSDETSRIVLGTVHVGADGGLQWAEKQPDPADSAQEKIWKEHTNPEHIAVKFGRVTADGSLLIEKMSATTWRITPMPRDRKIHIEMQLPGTVIGKNMKAEALSVRGTVVGAIGVRMLPGGRIALTIGDIKETASCLLHIK